MHSKERGEWAEMRFMARAAEHGLHITKPWGDSRRYDFVVEYNGRFQRVQVKSTSRKRGNYYVCTARSGNKPYCQDQVDFIAMYVISMIAVTARMVTSVLVFLVVAVGFTRGAVMMDVRMVSSTMAMIDGAHYIDLGRAN